MTKIYLNKGNTNRFRYCKINLNKYSVMGFSQETAQTKFDEYTYRIEALCNKIEELKAKIEVSQIFNQNG